MHFPTAASHTVHKCAENLKITKICGGDRQKLYRRKTHLRKYRNGAECVLGNHSAASVCCIRRHRIYRGLGIHGRDTLSVLLPELGQSGRCLRVYRRSALYGLCVVNIALTAVSDRRGKTVSCASWNNQTSGRQAIIDNKMTKHVKCLRHEECRRSMYGILQR